MAKVLLCIGCDDYQSLKKLTGAERDARLSAGRQMIRFDADVGKR